MLKLVNRIYFTFDLIDCDSLSASLSCTTVPCLLGAAIRNSVHCKDVFSSCN